MPRFFYIARDKNGNKVSGLEEGMAQEEVISRLQLRDLIVLNVILEEKVSASAVKRATAVRFKYRSKHYAIREADMVLFCRQLATLLGAGVTILKSLDIISKQIASLRLYNVIADIQKRMEEGLSLHEAMARHPRVFSDLWVNLAESGEASGNIAVILGRLASYLERTAAFKRKVISALIYPAILLVVGLGALLFLTIKIIPTFTEIFSGFDIQLPALTKVLIAVSAAIRVHFFHGIIILTIGIFILRKYISTKDGRKNFEVFLFGLPLLGDFIRVVVTERFTSEMTTLVESGVPILYSLEITEKSVGNLVLADIINKIKENVRQGRPIGESLEKSGFFEPMVVQMVSIGEEIGELPSMLKRLNVFFRNISRRH